MSHIEAMRTWLEALEALLADPGEERIRWKMWDKARASITSLRAAITQAEQQGGDTARLDYLARGSTVEILLQGEMAFRVGGLLRSENSDLRAAIDLARGAGEV